MKKKILILYATYGSGHKSIAEYIKKYFEESGKYECETIDLITYSMPIVGKLSRKTSNFIMTKIPSLWSIIYFAFDNKLSAFISGKVTLKMLDNKNMRRKIADFDPEITIATHFFGNEIISEYNKRELTNSKLVTVVTDYKSHDFWTNSLKSIDAIIVSSIEERISLLKKGFKNKQIYTSGIPIMPEKCKLDKNKLINKFKINKDKKTVLFFAGGGSGGALLNLIYFKEILKNNYDCNILFIAGKNKRAYEKAVEYVKKYDNKNARIYGFVTNVNEFYTVSDFVVTKPGGAQVTECLYFEKPMLLIKSNGGQEIENRRYLCRSGYAKSAKTPMSFNKNFKDMLEDETTLNYMKKKIGKIDQSKSMEKLYKIIENL